METTLVLILLFAVFLPILLLTGLIIYSIRKYSREIRTSQDSISDKELLLLIQKQPDGLLSGKQLAERTGMSTTAARLRMYNLYSFGVLKVHYTNLASGFYSLSEPFDDKPKPELTDSPFLTVEDILTLFRHYDFRLSPQQLILATGLPLKVIKREIKYFQSQKILQTLTQTDSNGLLLSKTFVLLEPYRSHPEQFLEKQLDLNEAMEMILRKEDLV